MITVVSTINTIVNMPLLRTAAAASFGAAFIDCNETDNGASLTVYLTNPVTGQQATWDGLCGAQDPVRLAIDKTTVLADGTDFATVTVSALKPGAAAVTLAVVGPGGATTLQPVTLAAGVGSVQIKTSMYGLHTVSIQNPANRCSDSFSLTGV